MSPKDRQAMIEEFNLVEDDAMLGRCLSRLLECTAERHLDKTALICTGTQMTYGELNTKANRLARNLVERGIKRGDLVGVALDRSVDLVVVLVAVLKSGAAYVPIDPAFPAERIGHMMENALPKLIVAEPSMIATMTSLSEACLAIDEVRGIMSSDRDSSNLDIHIQPEDIAYVVYTSGSTGLPKGVEISHGAVSNFVLAMQRGRGCAEDGRILAITTVSFDMAGYELWVPLVCGSTTVIAQTHQLKDAHALLGLMERHAITMMIGTPATWQMLLDAGWRGKPRLRSIICGGEQLSVHLAERLLEYGDTVWNQYGPAEATVCASVWKVRRGEDVSIGKPIANVRMYVLDKQLSPVPVGCSGELYIGGAGVARGYRNNAEATQSKFLRNPFHEGRLYRTGDLGRFVTPNKLILVGRADSQVKIRGHRIETGDVEAAIAAHRDISTAVVVCRDGRLVAYYVRDGANVGMFKSGRAAEVMLSNALRSWLSNRLPAYMIPAFFVELNAFQVTLNGKVDRAALPDPISHLRVPAGMGPSTVLERQIFDIWSNVLGHECIGVNDNFFHIGGDSARAVRVQADLIKALGRPVSTAKLFEHYTIKTLAAFLSGEDEATKPYQESAARHRVNENKDEMIAVISTACRLPGINTPEEFWELLDTGGDVITDVPKDRWDADALYDADAAAPGKSYCRRGGFIASIDSFDASFFGISPREARKLDPTQYMMLETCWEGFERAGYTMDQLRGSQTGVFIGVSNAPAYQCCTRTRELADLDGYAGTGCAGGLMSGRIAYTLGLEGPALTVDTACSSSLVATHLACMSLRQGECDMAVAGGVSLLLTPGLHVEFSRLQGMSRDGRCRAFSADAQGTGWGEGCAAVVLKRLSDARRDGDVIAAVLRGTAVNHGGRGSGPTVPSGRAQRRLITTALASSGLQPADIDYVEAHGTGTKLGDPIEGTALAEVFTGSHSDAEPLWIGSAKSNLGHTQAAAGLVGLLKVVLAMRHNKLPKTLHATQPTPAVDWQRANMALVQESRPWLSRRGRPRRAGVSAFGIGGTNAHVIVEEARPACQTVVKTVATAVDSAPSPGETVPVLLSACANKGLRQQVEKLMRHLCRDGAEAWRFIDTAYSLATTRNHFRHRLVLMAKDRGELLDKLTQVDTCSSSAVSPPDGHRLAMLFTGQGTQLCGMGRELAKHHAVFHTALDNIASNFKSLIDKPMLEVMWSDDDDSAAGMLLRRTDYAQPALFALEVALFRLWESWGVRPSFLLGHSVGELAAAHVAGVMDLPDACRLVAARGRFMQAVPSRGAMVSLEANVAEVAAGIEALDLDGKVCISCQNSPTQTVASGDVEAVEMLATYFRARGSRAKMLEASHAFHSHHMDAMLVSFRAVAETVRFRPATLAIVSCLTGRLAEIGQLERASYWVEQARQPVLFSDGIRTLADQGASTFLELGPRPLLCGIGAECLGGTDAVAWLPSLVPGQADAAVVLGSLAQLHIRHVPIDWSVYFKSFGCRRVELPTYAFQREPAGRGATDAIRQDRFQFEINWRRENGGVVPPTVKGRWGILCPVGEVPWACEVETALSRAGIQTLRVGRLEEANEVSGLLCLWHSDVHMLHQTRDFAAKALALLQAAAQAHFAPPVVWVTRNAVNADTNPVSGLGAAPLWGLARTARIEHPELCLRLIDLGQGDAAALVAALNLEAEPECAVRQGLVFVPRMQRVRSEPRPTPAPLLRRDGAVLITGGLGNIGKHVARWLARDHGIRDLVINSRRGMQAPGAEELVKELSHLGARVTIVSGNVGDLNSAQAIIAMFHKDNRPLRGIVHAAGLLDDGVISSLTPQRCHTVFVAKVDGAWHLHRLTREMDLDLFVMFSSLSGIMGNAGQGNYAAANTFLDSLAHLRHTEGLAATSIAWGLWDGKGMGARLGATVRSRYSKAGINPLATQDGLQLLERAVRRGRALTVAAACDLPMLKDYHGNRGSIPPLLQSLLSGLGSRQTTGCSEAGDLRMMLDEAPRERHEAIVLDVTRDTVAKALGFASPDHVGVDLPLQDIGIDSLTAVLTRNQLMAATGLSLSARLAFNYPNLRALSQFLLSQLQDGRIDDDSSTTTSLGPATPATTISAYFPSLDLTAIGRGCLDSSFRFENATGFHTPPSSVFVTGSTGFVGAFLVHELLERGIDVHCLIRADSMKHARQRLVDTLNSYGLWKPDYSPFLNVVVGDMAQPYLGLSADVFDQLAEQVDAICHSGALVDWMRPMSDYLGPNMVSTHEVLRLASQGRGKAIHLVSTVATVPRHLGYDVPEDEYEYYYATSKFMAERMVAAARWRGARAAIYRIPYVTASAATGHFRLARGDFLHNLIVGSINMGHFPSLDGDLSIVLPVDYLCRTMVSIMSQGIPQNPDFDFTNTHAPTFNAFFKMMIAAGAGEEVVCFSAWREKALAYAAAHPTSHLARIAAVLDGCAGEQDAAAMFKSPYLGKNVFGVDQYPVPPVDEQYIRRYLNRIRDTKEDGVDCTR